MRSQYPPMSPGFAPCQADPIVDATDFRAHQRGEPARRCWSRSRYPHRGCGRQGSAIAAGPPRPVEHEADLDLELDPGRPVVDHCPVGAHPDRAAASQPVRPVGMGG